MPPMTMKHDTDPKKELLDKLPPAEAYTKAKFPTLAEEAAAKPIITKQWDAVVGANVTK